jgi:hypothetical protein
MRKCGIMPVLQELDCGERRPFAATHQLDWAPYFSSINSKLHLLQGGSGSFGSRVCGGQSLNF